MSPKNKKLLKLAVGIARRSDHKQKNNASIETQSEEIHLRANKEGYEILEIFIDDANSAYHKIVTKRQAMQDLLETVLSEEIEAVFFYEESRVSRQFYDFTLFIHDVIKKEKTHVKFFSTCREGEWDPYNIVSVINLATAADLSIKKSRRAKDGQKTALGKNQRPGSSPPFGYYLEYPTQSLNEGNIKKLKGELLLHKDEAAIVLFIFYLTSWGHSQKTIAELLKDAGVPSPTGKEWSGGTVDYILNNDNYVGHLSWNIRTHRNTSRKKQRGEYDLIFNHHDPIISVLLWNITHQTVELHKQNGKNNKSQFILRGLLYCYHCNEMLTAKNETPKNSNKEYLVYRCKLCKHKLKINEIHDEIINELSSKWYMRLMNMSENVVKMLSKRKINIEKYRNEISNQLKEIILKEEFLLNSPEAVNQNNNWDFILSISKSKLKKELSKANSFIEHIELLDKHFQANQIFSLLKLQHLQEAELRTLLLTLFKSIQIDFKNGKLIYIEYNLAPFVEIDQYFESIDRNKFN